MIIYLKSHLAACAGKMKLQLLGATKAY